MILKTDRNLEAENAEALSLWERFETELENFRAGILALTDTTAALNVIFEKQQQDEAHNNG